MSTAIHNQVHGKKAQEAIKSLSQDRTELKEKLEEEKHLNDKNAQRISDLEDTLEALEDAIEWMENEEAA